MPIDNISPSDDTLFMQNALQSVDETINIGAAGTTMRFLTAYFAAKEGARHVLTGSDRMLQRPIFQLVNALQHLGAAVEYRGQEGFPPLYIVGKKLAGGKLTIEAGISSQFISALLLIAPALSDGLHLTLEGERVSETYVQMTLEYMKKYGVEHVKPAENVIYVPPKQYYHIAPDVACYVESDWSAASYYYALAALADEADITLKGLLYPSVQGDSAIVSFMAHFGVKTTVVANGILRLVKKRGTLVLPQTIPPTFDCIACPDIAQTMVVVAAGLRQKLVFEGLQTLRIKETDRCAALAAELKKFGVLFEPLNDRQWQLDARQADFGKCLPLVINTYDDHRMAMSFAALALCCRPNSIGIENPSVVRKSYPNFWRDVAQLGLVLAQK